MTMAEKPNPNASAMPNSHAPAMPRQVREQMAAAERLRNEMNGKPAEAPQPEIATAPNGKVIPEKTPEAPQPAVEAPPAREEPPGGTGEPDNALRTLQGRYEAERRNAQALAERLQNLEQTLSTMRIRGAEETPAEQPPAPVYEKLITDKEEEDYGKEMLDVVGRRARETFAPEFVQLGQRLAKIESQLQSVGTVMARTSEEKVYDKLNHDVEGWEDINFRPEFKDWLAVPDPFSGMPRQAMLNDAFARHDAERVVRFFKGFIAEASGLPQTPQAKTPAAPPLPGNGQGSEQPSLLDFAAPGRARSAPQSELPPEKPVYSQAQIAKFYADMRTGKWKGREADAAAIEKDIFQAQHEGRIQ